MSEAVTIAIPCRTDEPELGRTLAAIWDDCAGGGVLATTLVCLNGDADGRAVGDLEEVARRKGSSRQVIDADRDERFGDPMPAIGVIRTRRVGKAIAWNLLRAAVRTPIVVFVDADVALAPGSIARLVDALATHPTAVLASPKTTCAARPTCFEAVMAAPYAFEFPNLSGQLYAARAAGLPETMPEDLIEPERWLELVVGSQHMVRDPRAQVVVRLPGSLADFYRQRIRIEMGKVQLRREYAALLDRGNPQPGWRMVAGQARPAALLRLAAYLALRESAHVVARRRFGRRTTAEVWHQPVSTKRWRE